MIKKAIKFIYLKLSQKVYLFSFLLYTTHYTYKKVCYGNCFKKKYYRLKIGNNRALFEVHQDKIVVIVLDIGSCGDIYKKGK